LFGDVHYKRYAQEQNKRVWTYYITVDCFIGICEYVRHAARKKIATHWLRKVGAKGSRNRVAPQYDFNNSEEEEEEEENESEENGDEYYEEDVHAMRDDDEEFQIDEDTDDSEERNFFQEADEDYDDSSLPADSEDDNSSVIDYDSSSSSQFDTPPMRHRVAALSVSGAETFSPNTFRRGSHPAARSISLGSSAGSSSPLSSPASSPSAPRYSLRTHGANSFGAGSFAGTSSNPAANFTGFGSPTQLQTKMANIGQHIQHGPNSNSSNFPRSQPHLSPPAVVSSPQSANAACSNSIAIPTIKPETKEVITPTEKVDWSYLNIRRQPPITYDVSTRFVPFGSNGHQNQQGMPIFGQTSNFQQIHHPHFQSIDVHIGCGLKQEESDFGDVPALLPNSEHLFDDTIAFLSLPDEQHHNLSFNHAYYLGN